MKKIIKVCLVIAIALCTLHFGNIKANEDITGPELVYVEVLNPSINAGESIQVKIRVKESETGLKKAFLQFNHAQVDKTPFSTEKVWSTPVYSSNDGFIEFTMSVPSSKNTRPGDWFIGYLEFYDQKGNFSRYCGYRDAQNMYSEFVEPTQYVNGTTHVQIQNVGGDIEAPKMNSVQLLNTSIDKPNNLKLKVNFSESSSISYVQINAQTNNYSDTILYQVYDLSNSSGTKDYVFEIPVGNNKHNGAWEVVDIYVKDVNGNEAHYTNQIVPGSFADYYDPSITFAPLKFTVQGVAGDEVKPSASNIRIVNENQTVEKPGLLYVELNLVEENSGISNVVLEYERTDGNAIDVNSRGIHYFSVQGYETNQNDETILDTVMMSGTYTFAVPVPSIRPNGKYRIHIRELSDCAGNKYANYTDSGLKANFTVSDEFDYALESGISNKQLLKKVNSLKDGETARILLGDNIEDNILKKEVLNSIAGKNKKLVCYKDGYQWIFDGRNIKANQTKDLNLSVNISIIDKDYLSSGQNAICLSFENNGALPGNVEFRFKSSFVKKYLGKEEVLRLYHVEEEESGIEEEIDYINCDYEEILASKANIRIVLDGGDSWCYVNLDHNSKYVLSANKIQKLNNEQIKKVKEKLKESENKETLKEENKEEKDKNKDSKEEKDKENPFAYILEGILILAGIIIIVFRKPILKKIRK